MDTSQKLIMVFSRNIDRLLNLQNETFMILKKANRKIKDVIISYLKPYNCV